MGINEHRLQMGLADGWRGTRDVLRAEVSAPAAAAGCPGWGPRAARASAAFHGALRSSERPAPSAVMHDETRDSPDTTGCRPAADSSAGPATSGLWARQSLSWREAERNLSSLQHRAGLTMAPSPRGLPGQDPFSVGGGDMQRGMAFAKPDTGRRLARRRSRRAAGVAEQEAGGRWRTK